MATGPSAPSEVPPLVNYVLRSSGQPLDRPTREYLEPRFGHDFGDVRVHANSRASESARAIDAAAYTVGRDIVFGAGRYAPGTLVGRQLLAHELTHILQQQRAGNIEQKQASLALSTDSQLEHEADTHAAIVTAPDATGPRPLAGNQTSAGLQRQTAEQVQPDQTDGNLPAACDAPADLPCPFDCAPGPTEGSRQTVHFSVNQSGLSSPQKKEIDDFVASSTADGKTGRFQVDGYASVDGARDFNWRLSCDRAKDVEAEIGTRGATATTIAHGATTEFSPSFAERANNRRATITFFPSAGPTPPTDCPDLSAISQEKDPLPPVPPFTFKTGTGPEVREEVRKMDPDSPLPPTILGASKEFPEAKGVTVSTVPIPGSTCLKCVADWAVSAVWKTFVSQGFVISGEPRRFAAPRQGDDSGCPPVSIPHLLDVRETLSPEFVSLLIAGEREHYNDFVRSFQLAAGRHLSNVRRLTPNRTHLQGKDLEDCKDKVGAFLADAGGIPSFMPGLLKLQHISFLDGYSGLFKQDFADLGLQSLGRDKGENPPHSATPRPPEGRNPIFPNIDLARNPFGCGAFARRLDQTSLPGVPGVSSDVLIKDRGSPPKQAWHAL